MASDGTTMSELTKPGIEVPEGDAPTELTIRDLVIGDGPEARPGRVVQVHYVGVTFASGREFDSSWEQGGRTSSPWAAARSSRAGTGE